MSKDINIFSPFALVLIYAVCVFTPLIMQYSFLVPLLVGTLFSLVTLPKIFSQKEKLFTIFLILIIVSFTYKIVGISTGDIGNYGNRLSWFYAVWMSFYMWQYRTEKERKLLAIVISAVFLPNLIYTAYFHYINPEFSAIYQTLDDSIYTYGKVNIGSTSVTIAALFYTLFLLLYVRINRYKLSNAQYRSLCIIEILLLYYIIVWGDSTTTTLTLFVSVLFIFFQSRKTVIGPVLMLGAGILIYNMYQDDIVAFCRNYINDRFADRLMAMSHASSGNTTDDDDAILSRFPMLMFDIEMWFHSLFTLLFGNGYHTFTTGNVLSDTIANKAGGHSAIFDTIARYGLLGLLLVVALCKELRLWLKNNIPNSRYAAVILAVIIFSNIMNVTLAANVLFIICFFFPFLKSEQNYD